MKKIIAMLLASVMVLSLAACGSSAPATAEAPAATETAAKEEAPAATEAEPIEVAKENQEETTLTAWYFQVTGIDGIMEEWAEKVHETYPWLTVELECLPGDTGPEKFTVACATGTTPDIYFDGYSRIAPAIYADLTADLTDIYDKNKALFLSEQVDGVVDGEYRYIAYEQGAPYDLQVNMTLAEELGVKDMLPADMMTWSYDDFLALCRKVKEADDSVYPIALYAADRSSDAWDYSWFIGNDAALLNDDHTKTVINEDGNKEKIQEVLTLYKTLVDEKLVPDGVASLSDDDCIALFNSGKLLFEPACAFNYVPQTYTSMEDGSAVEFVCDAVCLPTPEGKTPSKVASWGNYGVCAFKNNGHEEQAKLAIDLLLNDGAWLSNLISTDGKLPLTNNVTLSYSTDEITEIMNRGSSYGAQYSDASFGILEPFWSDFRETFYIYKQDLFVGNITPEQFTEKWAESADAVLADYYAAQ